MTERCEKALSRDNPECWLVNALTMAMTPGQAWLLQDFIEEIAIHASRVIEPERLIGSGVDRRC